MIRVIPFVCAEALYGCHRGQPLQNTTDLTHVRPAKPARAARLFVAQRLDGVQAGGADRRVYAADDTHDGRHR